MTEKDREKEDAIYYRVYRQLEREIRTGKRKEGERLPAERKATLEFQAARNTIKQAYAMLCREGLAYAVQGSGTYVMKKCQGLDPEQADRKIEAVLDQLVKKGMSQSDIEWLFQETAWEKLPEEEKIRVAWVDCSEEFIQETAREIQEFCNVTAVPFLLDDVRNKKEILIEEYYDMYATTINHFEELRDTLKNISAPEAEKAEMVSLYVDTACIGNIANLQADQRTAVIFDSEWYRYSVECFLKEFGAQGEISYVEMKKVEKDLEVRLEAYQCILLPQSMEYGGDVLPKIQTFCRSTGKKCFPFVQMIDKGSLLHLRKRAYEIWIEK
ncbi:MAG TPA: GntR family transcriptional regulator [Candidatus Blautia stercoravium]|nr:GntR family transcriptional regulator [Candidatus Blautia stercoravium]